MAAVVNPNLDGNGFGVYVRYDKTQLPEFIQWKMMGNQEYVCGIEPGTNWAGGKEAEKKAKRLITLRPGHSHSTSAKRPWPRRLLCEGAARTNTSAPYSGDSRSSRLLM